MIRFLSDNFRWIVGGFLLTSFSSFGQTFFIGLSGEELRSRFSLSDGEFGLYYMLATLASALSLPFLGRVMDFVAGWRVACLVMPALAGACLLLAFAPNLALMVFAIYLLRLFGQGMMTHIALTEIARWFSANRGRAMSLVVPGHQAGEAILPITFALIAASLGWQSAWIGAALVLGVFALPVLVWLWRVERVPQLSLKEGEPVKTTRDWTVREVVRDPLFYFVMIGVLAPPFIGTTLFFHQDYLMELRGYDPLAFAAAFPVMALTTVLFALVCGHFVDRFGALRLLPFFLIPLGFACMAAAFIEPVGGVYLFMFLLGISYGFSSTLFGALWPEIYGLRYLGSVRSIIIASMVFSTALGPGLTGWLIDDGVALPVQMIFMGIWCFFACILLGFVAPKIIKRNTLWLNGFK